MIPFSSRSFSACRARLPLIFNLSTKTATVINLYDWTSLLSLSVVALSKTTAWLALSLTISLVSLASKLRHPARLLGMQTGGYLDVPFPFDHFFFCFLPPEVAAGAWRRD